MLPSSLHAELTLTDQQLRHILQGRTVQYIIIYTLTDFKRTSNFGAEAELFYSFSDSSLKMILNMFFKLSGILSSTTNFWGVLKLTLILGTASRYLISAFFNC